MDRDSLYLDTLSFKSGYSTDYRKSLTLSQRTVYHSTEDIQSNLSLKDIGNGHFLDEERYRSYNGSDEFDQPAAISVSRRGSDKDEVSNLLPNHNNSLNKKRKEIVTYKEWKSRVIQMCLTPFASLCAYGAHSPFLCFSACNLCVFFFFLCVYSFTVFARSFSSSNKKCLSWCCDIQIIKKSVNPISLKSFCLLFFFSKYR